MKLILTKKFKKSLKKQSQKIKEKTEYVLILFTQNPKHKSLRRHKLKGKYLTKESLDVTGDIRIIIEPTTHEIIEIIDIIDIIDICDIGTHSYLYK